MRKAAGLTLAGAAEVFGYSTPHLSNVECGRRKASADLVRKYESLLTSSVAPDQGPGTAPRRSGARLATAGVVGDGTDADTRLDDFATALMRRRLARKWSLTMLALRTGISKSHLGNIEAGRRHPGAWVAESCDIALRAGGALIRLAGERRSDTVTVPAPPVLPAAEDAVSAVPDPEEVMQSEHGRLLALRSAAQRLPPQDVLPDLAAGSRLLAAIAPRVGGALGREVWLLAARYAEFTGWMVQEAGRDVDAVRWTETAARWAALGGDRDVASYGWERRALTTLYRGDGPGTVALARRGVRVSTASPRVLGLALRREAQGHALAGDRAACQEALRRAAKLMATAPPPFPGGVSWGPNTIADDSALVEASCLVDLGLHREAAALFTDDPAAGVPARALRTRVRFASRGAMALAGAGEIGPACGLLSGLLADAARVDSATIRADLRRTVTILNRHRGDPQVRALLPDLHNLLRPR